MAKANGAQTTEAVFAQGVFKPLDRIALPEQQRVRLTVEPLDHVTGNDRQTALRRLRQGIDAMNFDSGGQLPTRDELHDRI